MATPGYRSFPLGAASGRSPEERAAAAAAIRRVRLDPEERRRQRRDNFGLPAAPMSRALAVTRAEGRPGARRRPEPARRDAGSVRIPDPARRPVRRPAPRDGSEPIHRLRSRRRRTGVVALLLAAAALVGVDLARGPDYRPVSAPGGTVVPAHSYEPPTRSADGRHRAGPAPTTPAVRTSVVTSPVVRTPAPATSPPPPGGEVVMPEKAGAFATQGTGRFGYAAGPGPVLGRAGMLRRFHVVTEGGAGVEAGPFAAEVDRILGDRRSWIAAGQFRLQRVSQGQGA